MDELVKKLKEVSSNRKLKTRSNYDLENISLWLGGAILGVIFWTIIILFISDNPFLFIQ